VIQSICWSLSINLSVQDEDKEVFNWRGAFEKDEVAFIWFSVFDEDKGARSWKSTVM
jgi:hypothetical protein